MVCSPADLSGGAEERSFSRAAAKVHRTQPAGARPCGARTTLSEQLFDRNVQERDPHRRGVGAPQLRPAVVRLAEEAERPMRELRGLRRGRVLIGCNTKLPCTQLCP